MTSCYQRSVLWHPPVLRMSVTGSLSSRPLTAITDTWYVSPGVRFISGTWDCVPSTVSATGEPEEQNSFNENYTQSEHHRVMRVRPLTSLDRDVSDSVGIRLGAWNVPVNHGWCVLDVGEAKVSQRSEPWQKALQICVRQIQKISHSGSLIKLIHTVTEDRTEEKAFPWCNEKRPEEKMN